MESQKLENLLNVSLQVTETERKESLILDSGFHSDTKQWDLIIKYSGDLSSISDYAAVTVLQGGYAIVTLNEADIPRLTANPLVEFIEKPKTLYTAVNTAVTSSCILYYRHYSNPELPDSLLGRGTIIACIDSGIDYTHPDFIDDSGSSRILFIWDQGAAGTPPSGYRQGAEFTREQINAALRLQNRSEREQLLPHWDFSGHGTAVLGIAAGNGRASNRNYPGVAPDCDIIVVKLGTPDASGFPRTLELMQAIDYVSRKGAALGRPTAINLSFGNNYGGHDGESLLEQFIDQIAGIGRTAICVGTGNEAAAATHTGGLLKSGQTEDVYFSISPYETNLCLQLWKQYVDDISISLITPTGIRVGPLVTKNKTVKVAAEDMELIIFYGEPSPYSMSQEIFIDFINRSYYLQPGLWSVHLEAQNIINGKYDIWMPGSISLNSMSRFYYPDGDTTLTIPSTARKVISVGAYNHHNNNYATFSGRGPTRLNQSIKPDLAAPGVDIMSTAAGGGYDRVTGTSFATPFVTGAAALLMEWGIVKGNDPYLYGEKLKACLLKGARRRGQQHYPDSQWGWGRLCLEDSFP